MEPEEHHRRRARVYFTGARLNCLSHEGRQHAVRYVGGDADGVTSVEVPPHQPGCPTSGRLTCSTPRRSSFADALSRTSSTRPRPRSGRRWLRFLGLDVIESLREDLQRARNDLRKTSKAAEEPCIPLRSATQETALANLQQISAGCWLSPRIAGSGRRAVWITGSRWREQQRLRLRPIPRKPPLGNQRAEWSSHNDVVAAWMLVSSD